MRIRMTASKLIAIARLTAFLALTSSLLCGQDSSKAKPLPTVQQVMDRYVSALGGRDAIFKHKSMTLRGKFFVGTEQGPSLDRTVYYKGGKMLFEIALPNNGRYQEGFDGKVAWQFHSQTGPAISEGNEVKAKERDADMYYPAALWIISAPWTLWK